jgi:hypothetical protein
MSMRIVWALMRRARNLVAILIGLALASSAAAAFAQWNHISEPVSPRSYVECVRCPKTTRSPAIPRPGGSA